MRIALVGPTASGKTAVGIALARRLGAEIVSADSMQVYRGMDIGTAKPSANERAQVVFHAINVVNPDQEWTLAHFQRLGEQVCREIETRGPLPLIVGGTGLYVRALTTRLDIPAVPPDEEFRAHWRAIAVQRGSEFVQNELARVDPEAAARIHVNDLNRLIRALEVYALTGVTLSELHALNRKQVASENVLLFGLHFADRRNLYARIEARVDQMLADGLLDEVRSLLAAGYARDLKPMQSLGYRHMTAYLSGEMAWEMAVELMKRDTRHYARRQLIWFRAESRIHWRAADEKTPAALADEIETQITHQLKE